jgi:NADPH:quinone reductase-like Zn-dependent oxidoreductase
MKALVIVESSTTESGRDIELREVPVPELVSGQYRVKTEAVAMNPTDWYVTPATMMQKHADAQASQEIMLQPKNAQQPDRNDRRL